MDKAKELTAWLQLIRLPNVGPATLLPLLQQGLSAIEICQADQTTWRSWELKEEWRLNLPSPSSAAIEQDLLWLSQADHHLITWSDRRYPDLLRTIDYPPLGLWVNGNPDLLNPPQIAIVGSRNPTAQGRETAYEFARQLAQAGLTITSGLALGIDAASHQASYDQLGKTIAVLGTGPDRIYPSAHKSLANQILAYEGALISEFPTGVKALPENFPRRNRLISGLSQGTVVIEAALRSGSLITARLAAEQGRDVFAIPGSIHNPLARGCHFLIKQGAKLVETAQDILEELEPLLACAAAETPVASPAIHLNLDENCQLLIKNLDFTPTPIDILIARTGFTAEVVSSMLLVLELQGLVESSANGYNKR